jgi:hypothetical protein
LIKGYDDWKLDTPDNHVVEIGECCYCEYVIYEGEDHVDFTEGLFHSECWWEFEDNRIYEEENE